MASRTRPPSPPPAPVPASAEDLSSAGGQNRDPSMTAPAPEKENTPAPLAPAAADAAAPNPTKPAKKRRPPVPMTDEERETLMGLKERYESATEERRAQKERLTSLARRRDELLYQKRCVAARVGNRVVSLRANIAHARHQRRLGWAWKAGEPVPEEIAEARHTILIAQILCVAITDDMAIGVHAHNEAFVYQEYKKKMNGESSKDKEVEVDAQHRKKPKNGGRGGAWYRGSYSKV